MSTQLKKLINAIVNKNNTKPPRKYHARRNKRKSNSSGMSTRAMPAAYAAHVRPRFNILSRSDRHCIVSGCDLIYKIPATLTSNGDAIFSVITANPAYWKGTRIGRIAPAYQTYRPISFKVSYVPQVAVTQPGIVFMGTMWDMAPPQDNLQQSLLTSNGGQLTQCYIPADSTVALGRNLQQNLFKTAGSLNTDTNPFIFCVGVAGANVVPGYLYITYKYELRNPIGDSWTFINSGITTVSSLPIQDNSANGSVILMNQVNTLGPGTILDREAGSNQFYYHGSQLDLPDQTNLIYYNNFQTNTNTAARNILLPEINPTVYLSQFVIGTPNSETNPIRSFSEFEVLPSTSSFKQAVVIYMAVSTQQYFVGWHQATTEVSYAVPSGYKAWIYQSTKTNPLDLRTEEGTYIQIPLTKTEDNINPVTNCVSLPLTVRIENLIL